MRVSVNRRRVRKTDGSVVKKKKKKNLPAMQETQETWVQPLGREDPLEEGMATHSSIPAWRIAQTEEGGHPEGRLRGAYCGLKVCVSREGLRS